MQDDESRCVACGRKMQDGVKHVCPKSTESARRAAETRARRVYDRFPSEGERLFAGFRMLAACGDN